MALGTFRKFLTAVSFLTALSALALAIFAAVGSVTNKSKVIDTIHLVRLDLSNLDLTEAFADSNIAQIFRNLGEQVSISASDFGFSNTYGLSYWGYCSSYGTGAQLRYDYCTKPKALYHFDLQDFLQSHMDQDNYSTVVSELVGSAALQISLPDGYDDYNSTIESVSKLIFICTFIGIGVFAVQLFVDHFAKRSHALSVLSFLLGLAGAAAFLLAAAASTAMYKVVQQKVHDKLGSLGIKVILDPVYYGLIWGAFGAALLSTIGWMFAICCGRTDVHEYVEDYKE